MEGHRAQTKTRKPVSESPQRALVIRRASLGSWSKYQHEEWAEGVVQRLKTCLPCLPCLLCKRPGFSSQHCHIYPFASTGSMYSVSRTRQHGFKPDLFPTQKPGLDLD